jgi:nicotinate-nucleotide pyrophosphorylase (carboxylating)
MHAVDQLIALALAEDIGPGDITTEHLVPATTAAKGVMVAKQALVTAGIEVASQVFHTVDKAARVIAACEDGQAIEPGEVILTVEGPAPALLMGERTALNFLQRLSGIATQTRSYVEAVANYDVRLVDTRKTTPGWRSLEKYAVRCGGAFNHRMGLYDGVLIKDNHIAVSGGIEAAVQGLRPHVSHLVKIEVETTTLSEVEEALAAGADVIMLDNMDTAQIREAVALIDGRALTEVSGGVTRKRLHELAATGVDLISIGALTHSAAAVDISMSISVRP